MLWRTRSSTCKRCPLALACPRTSFWRRTHNLYVQVVMGLLGVKTRLFLEKLTPLAFCFLDSMALWCVSRGTIAIQNHHSFGLVIVSNSDSSFMENDLISQFSDNHICAHHAYRLPRLRINRRLIKQNTNSTNLKIYSVQHSDKIPSRKLHPQPAPS